MAAAARRKKGLFSWMESSIGVYNSMPSITNGQKYARPFPAVFPQDVPGVTEDLLRAIALPGGALDEKLERITEAVRAGAWHQESLQKVVTTSALQQEAEDESPVAQSLRELPPEVREVIEQGSYTDSFLRAFDGQAFPIHADELAPWHEYRLALEVHAGGKYWAAMDDNDSVRHLVLTVDSSSSSEGSPSVALQFGSAQRGAAFVWRWHYDPELGPYDLPNWLANALQCEGHDPLRKLECELGVLKRWELQVHQEAATYARRAPELQDPYLREVLRLWPSFVNAHGTDELKPCAWIDGLPEHLFVGKNVVLEYVHYDMEHKLALRALVSKRHQGEPIKEDDPPYRLALDWRWVPPLSSGL